MLRSFWIAGTFAATSFHSQGHGLNRHPYRSWFTTLVFYSCSIETPLLLKLGLPCANYRASRDLLNGSNGCLFAWDLSTKVISVSTGMNLKFLSSPKRPTETWLSIRRLKMQLEHFERTQLTSPKNGRKEGGLESRRLKSWNPARNPDPNTDQPLRLIVNSDLKGLLSLLFTSQKHTTTRFFLPPQCFATLQVFASIGLSLHVCSCCGGWESFRCFDPLGGAFGREKLRKNSLSWPDESWKVLQKPSHLTKSLSFSFGRSLFFCGAISRVIWMSSGHQDFKTRTNKNKNKLQDFFGWWFQIFVFARIWGRFPFWLIFLKGVEATN